MIIPKTCLYPGCGELYTRFKKSKRLCDKHNKLDQNERRKKASIKKEQQQLIVNNPPQSQLIINNPPQTQLLVHNSSQQQPMITVKAGKITFH